MQKLSGLVLDLYDDSTGEVLKEVYASAGDLPDLVKQAHAITQDEYARLPDEAFALVLEDGPIELKKFATIDEGNTVLSVVYFLKTAHKLPLEAQKVAASNLLEACGWYGLVPPTQLRKIAGIDSEEKSAGLLGAAMTATAVPGAVREAKHNLQATQGAGGAIMTPQQIQERKFSMGMVGKAQ